MSWYDVIVVYISMTIQQFRISRTELDTPEKRLEAIRDCVGKLPDVNYSTLKILLQHLKK